MSRGAAKAPITYAGPYDASRTYLPLVIVTASGTPYLSIATSTGVAPGTDPTKWLPFGGGGGVLGYAEVSYTFPVDIPADDTYVAATAATLNASYGDPALTASGDTITYAVGDAVGIYHVVAHLKLAPHRDTVPHTLDATDGVFTFTLLDPILDTADFTAVGLLAFKAYGNLVGQLRLDYEYAATPTCRWRNTIDTTGVLDVQRCDLFITRFASP